MCSDVGLTADGAAVYRERAIIAEKAEVDAERAAARASALAKVSKKDIRVALKGVEEAGAQLISSVLSFYPQKIPFVFISGTFLHEHSCTHLTRPVMIRQMLGMRSRSRGQWRRSIVWSHFTARSLNSLT
eukprot:COSAG06_NODE_2362_length_7003_cov_15.069815_7_plen_130_part_00